MYKCNVLLCEEMKEGSDRDKLKKKKAWFYKAALHPHLHGCAAAVAVVSAALWGSWPVLQPHCTQGGFALVASLNV